MNLRTIKVVIGREYSTRVKKKSFLITTFVVPILFAALCSVPALILFLSNEREKKTAVFDESGIVMSHLEDSKIISFQDYSNIGTMENLKEDFDNSGFDIILFVSPLDTVGRTVSVSTYSEKPLSIEIKEEISDMVNMAVEDYRLNLYKIEGLKDIIQSVKADVPITTFTVSEDGGDQISSSEVFMIISMVLSMIIYMFIAMFSGSVMQSVIEEKTSRVVEVLISSVKTTELMMGKIVGVALVALTQFVLWIVLTAVLVTGVGAVVGFDKLTEKENIESMAEMTAPGMDVTQASQMGELQTVLETLKNVDYPQLIFGFIVFFILGYLLYASLFAAIGSAADNEADTQQLQLPVTIPLMIAFFVGLYAFKAPDSSLVWWCSMIPFTSPIVMLSRIPLGVPGWELALSIGLLFITFLGCAWVSAKIYKVGVLMFGKKTTFKDLWNWLKMK